MTSPDLPTPVSLTLHAVNENDLVDNAIAAFRATTPEWVPQEGATEVVLIESLSLLVGQQVHALNQLPRVVLDGLIAIRGVERHAAVPANGQIAVRLAPSTAGTRVVPAGARFRVPTDEGGTADLVAIEAVSINPSDSLTAYVFVRSEPGTAANGVPVGTPVTVVEAMSWVESAQVTQQLGGGGDEESDTEFYSRAAAAFQRAQSTLVVDSQFATAALDVVGVGRATAWGLWDGTGSPGADGGHITVAVAGPDGAPVSAGIKADVLEELQAGSVAGLTIHVIDFTTVTMSLALTYVVDDGYDSATVNAAITTELQTWLNPASWPLGDHLTSANQIILRLGRVPGVEDVTALTGWTAVTGAAELPDLTGLTITAT